MKREENWNLHYKELKAHVKKYGHYPPRDTALYNWCRYNVKLKNKGLLDARKTNLLDKVDAMRKQRTVVSKPVVEG